MNITNEDNERQERSPVEQIVGDVLTQVQSKLEANSTDYLVVSKWIASVNGEELFESFVECYRCLVKAIEDGLVEEELLALIKQQLKLCFHDRENHSCAFSVLLDHFVRSKPLLPVYTLSVDKIDKFFEFIKDFNCISQLSLLIDLFNVPCIPNAAVLELSQKLLDSGFYIHSSIVINKLNVREDFDSNYLLLKLLFEVSKLVK